MSEHTLGPWEVHAEDLRGGKYWVVSRRQDFEPVDIHDSENGEADARLIAAAPTMFEYIVKRAHDGDDNAKSILETINASR